MTSNDIHARDRSRAGRNGSFDPIRFHRLLDDVRIERGISWSEIARLTGVSASTLTRIGQGRMPDADNLSALVAWAGLDANAVLGVTPHQEDDPITAVRIALRNDPLLDTDQIDAIVTTVRALRDAFAGRRSADPQTKAP